MSEENKGETAENIAEKSEENNENINSTGNKESEDEVGLRSTIDNNAKSLLGSSDNEDDEKAKKLEENNIQENNTEDNKREEATNNENAEEQKDEEQGQKHQDTEDNDNCSLENHEQNDQVENKDQISKEGNIAEQQQVIERDAEEQKIGEEVPEPSPVEGENDGESQRIEEENTIQAPAEGDDAQEKAIEKESTEHVTNEENSEEQTHLHSENSEKIQVEDIDPEREQTDKSYVDHESNGMSNNENINQANWQSDDNVGNSIHDKSFAFETAQPNKTPNENRHVHTNNKNQRICEPKPVRSSKAPRKKYVIPDHTYREDPNFPDSRLDELIQELLKTKKYPDEKYHQPMIKYADHMTEEAASNHNYAEATKYGDAATMLRNYYTNREGLEKEEREREKASNKLENAKVMIAEINKKWDDIIDEKHSEFKRMREELEAKHSKEESDYEDQWKNPNFLAQYSKPSTQLISLRSLEQKYCTAKLFDLAEKARKQSEQLAVVEANEARSRAIEDMKLRYESMKSRHEKALECFEMYVANETRNMEIRREKELYGWKQLVKRIETTAASNKQMREPVLFVPRPLRRKNTQGTQMLKLDTINLRKYVRTPKAKTVRHKKAE